MRAPSDSVERPPRHTALRDLARVFLTLGATSFGGPAVHIAMMEEEVVRRRRWLGRDEFLDYLGATNLIPGPNSTELAIHIGHARAGWAGLLVAGASFILPAFVIVWSLAAAYVRFGALPAMRGMLHGIQPAVVVVIAQALWALGRAAVKSRELALLAVLALAAVCGGVNEVVVLLAAGTIAVAWRIVRGQGASLVGVLATSGASLATAGATTTLPAVPSLFGLFAVFAKIGAVLFGSGYVLFAFLQADLVDRLGWLTQRQLLDAIAVGQVTPGPLFTTATFVGYVVAGSPGAVVATLGMFLPAFAFVAVSGPLVPRMRRSPWAAALLDGVNVASLALMVEVTWRLARATLVDGPNVALALGSGVALVALRVPSMWVLLGCALIGIARG